jgi:hypothetical protein
VISWLINVAFIEPFVLVHSSTGLPLAALAGLELDDQGMVAQSHGNGGQTAHCLDRGRSHGWIDQVAPW